MGCTFCPLVLQSVPGPGMPHSLHIGQAMPMLTSSVCCVQHGSVVKTVPQLDMSKVDFFPPDAAGHSAKVGHFPLVACWLNNLMATKWACHLAWDTRTGLPFIPLSTPGFAHAGAVACLPVHDAPVWGGACGSALQACSCPGSYATDNSIIALSQS